MKLSALNFNYNFHKEPAAKTFVTKPQLTNSSLVSFDGYVDDAMDSSSIHCPICGTKMLSQEKYQSLLEKAGKVTCSSDFLNLINEYDDYIPREIKEVLRNFDTEKDLNENFDLMNNLSLTEHKARVASAKKFLQIWADKLPENDKIYVLNILSSIRSNDNYYHYTQKVIPLIKKFDISKEDKFQIKKDIARIKNSSECNNVFHIKNRENYNISEISIETAKRIFRNSVLKKTAITQKEGVYDDYNNEVLVCSSCYYKAIKNSFLTPDVFEDLKSFKDSLNLYLKEISVVLGSKSQVANKDYVHKLINFVSLLSGKKFFSANEFNLLKVFNVNSARHASFAPIEQDVVDIHCAGCGSVMMPYSKRSEMEKDLQNASEIKDFLAVLDKYDKYINRYSKQIAATFRNAVHKNPNITEDELLELIAQKADHHSKMQLVKIMLKYAKQRDYIAKNQKTKDLVMIDNVLSALKDYINSGKFNDFRFNEMFEEVFSANSTKENCPSIIYEFMTDLRNITYINSLAKPNENDAIRDKSRLHTLVFNIFKPDFATADHLTAYSKSGAGTKNNLIGLCKACNSVIKSNRSIFSWLKFDPSIKYNFIRQMQDVNSLSNAGIITGYDDWAAGIAEAVYVDTRGKFDLRDKICKDL